MYIRGIKFMPQEWNADTENSLVDIEEEEEQGGTD